MRVDRRLLLLLAVALLMTASYSPAQNTPAEQASQPAAPAQSPSGQRAEVRNVTVVSGDSGPVIEISATRAITPQIRTIENPLRLVIDLPNSNLVTAKRRVPFRNPQIKGVRLNQFQTSPAISRIVVDLAAPIQYTWDARGTNLSIRIRADQAATAKPPSVPAFTKGVQPAAVPVAAGSSGTLVETGSRVASGSSITADVETAVMRLTRGGEVRVCPGTTVSFTTSSNGNDLMFGMSSGAVETDYASQESVDSVLTPDFRIVLPGPGQFNMAVSADSKGNTCVASLPGTTSSVVVAELLGNGTYEIKPEQQVLFRDGSLSSIETPVGSCGCPPAREPVLRTDNSPAAVVPDTNAGDKLPLAASDANGGTPNPESSSGGGGEAAETKSSQNEGDAPLVFSGLQRTKAAPGAPPPPVDQVAVLRLKKPADPLPAVVVLPPAQAPKPASKGFFRRLKGFFGSIFR